MASLLFAAHLNGLLKGVRPGQANVGLYDGHQALVLADKGIAGEVVHVRLDGEVSGTALGDVDDEGRAPLGKDGAGGDVLLTPGGKAVEALHDRVAIGARKGVDLEVGLHARQDAPLLQQLREKDPVVTLLVQGLGVKDRFDERSESQGKWEYMALEPWQS